MLFKRTSIAGLVLILALAGGVAADVVLNASHLVNVATGRARIKDACLPELVRNLAAQGFLPSDLEFAVPPAIGLFSGARRSFNSGFTFQDGPEALRVDGIMACVLDKGEIHVDFRTAVKPLRAG